MVVLQQAPTTGKLDETKVKLPDKKLLDHSTQVKAEVISPELKTYIDKLNKVASIVEEKLSTPLIQMIRDAKGNLNEAQQQTIHTFFSEGSRIFAEYAITNAKEILNFPNDIEKYSTDDKLALLRVELVNKGIFLDLAPKPVTVEIADKANITFGIFKPSLYQLSEVITGEEAIKLKNNKELILPKIEGASVVIPENANITTRIVMGDDLNSLHLSGSVISFIDVANNKSIQQIILNPKSIEERAKSYNMSLDNMHNHTLSNEVSSIALTEHLEKSLSSSLYHNKFDITLNLGPTTSTLQPQEKNLKINLIQIGELYSDITSFLNNEKHIVPILDHFDKRDEYSLITSSIFSAILKADSDGLIKVPVVRITADSLIKIFSGNRELEKEFAEKYLEPEMKNIFDLALKKCKKDLEELEPTR